MNTEFTDELRAAMTQLPVSVPPELVRNIRRRHRRRRATKWGATGASTAAVTGLAVALAVQAAPVSAPVDRTTAYVVSHVTSALDSLAPSTILFEKTTYLSPDSGEGWEHSWSTANRTRDQQFSKSGQLTTDEVLAETATTTTHLIVDYQNKTWSQITAVLPPESASPSVSPPSCASGAPDGWSPDPHQEADMLRTAVSCGFLTAVGGGKIDGVSTIKLSERPGAPPSNSTMTFWVNATTYLPVRIVQVWVNAIYAGGNLQMDMRWLPATPANKAELTVHIPTGFTHVPWGS